MSPGRPTAPSCRRRFPALARRLPLPRREASAPTEAGGPPSPRGEVLIAVAAALSAARDVDDVTRAVAELARTALRTTSADVVPARRGAHPRPSSGWGPAVDLPLVVDGEPLGSLVLRWERAPAMTPDLQAVLAALAACTGRALHRCRADSAGRTLTESLRASVRPALPPAGDLVLAGRYLPAGASSVLGGDWFDAFVGEDGTTTVVIGDVTGHGPAAAGEMTQLRGLLGNAATTPGLGPARALRELDRAIDRLALASGATALVVQIEQDAELRDRGVHRLRWSNAGHPAPLVRLPDGCATELAPAPELCLGVDPTAPRSDHVLDVPTGSTLLLFTDGLVESRRRDLTEGTALLRTELATSGGRGLDQLLDHLVVRMGDASNDDDVAALAVRLGAAPQL